MRTIYLVGLSLLASLGLSTGVGAQSHNAMAGHVAQPTTRPATGADTTILLTGPMGSRSPTGAVTIAAGTVRIRLTGDQPAATRPWSVHKGTCSRDEGIVGARGPRQGLGDQAKGYVKNACPRKSWHSSLIAKPHHRAMHGDASSSVTYPAAAKRR